MYKWYVSLNDIQLKPFKESESRFLIIESDIQLNSVSSKLSRENFRALKQVKCFTLFVCLFSIFF